MITCPQCGERAASRLPWSHRIAVGLTAGAVLFIPGLALAVIGLWPALLLGPVGGLALLWWPIYRCPACNRLIFRHPA